MKTIRDLINSYDPEAPLDRASTIPSSWYTDERIFDLEQQVAFANSWQVAARLDQFNRAGDYVTTEIAGEPIVIVRGTDNQIRGFFNVCSHHAAAVMTEAEGNAPQLRCPYHGWTYSLAGELRGTPDFSDVCDFDRVENGLQPIEIATWEKWIFASIKGGQRSPLNDDDRQSIFESALINQIADLHLHDLHWCERRRYVLNCNWKVFVDNYLDGGYHVPHLHKALDSVLDYSEYTIENGGRFCLQSSPTVSGVDKSIAEVRGGQRALYYWLYPNFMLNYYDGVFDTNLVRPITVDRTEVIFDFYFADVSAAAREKNRQSIDLSERIQDEDVAICESVQRGLNSRAYQAGRLSVRREAGEHLFHRLLHADLKTGVERQNPER
ncbi:MAG TPA: SRPBCC family protein [Pyrinomonadaceae bacterium]|jgi:choline monooxygenase|nr:SRPBCC family protein [Pyrinomonadaceae bacterium]